VTAAPGPRSSRPRSEANYGPQRGTTYLIHIDPPYKHAKHYKGWTDRPVGRRFADHLAGRGALLTRMAVQAGSRLTLARVWPDTTKDREDSIKRHGGGRMCPECGVKPAAPRLASDKPPGAPVAADRRPMWMADRDGQWNDGTPIIFDPDQTWKQARAIRAAMPIPEPDPAGQAELAALDELQRQWTNQEEQMGLRNAIARGGAAIRGHREAHRRSASAREADRLWAIADQLDKQMGRRPGYQHELTAERAARIRARLGEDLVQDARLEAMPRAEGEPLEHWAITLDDVAQAGREPVLQGAERDAEIDRLADAFPEPDDLDAQIKADLDADGIEPELTPEAEARTQAFLDHAADLYVAAPGAEPAGQSTAGEAEQLAAAQPDLSAEEIQAFQQAERERWAQADRDTEYAARQAAQYYGPEIADLLGIEPGDAVQAPGPEPGDDAATWSPALEAEAAELAPEDRLTRDLEDLAARAELFRGQERAALARERLAEQDAIAEGARQTAERMREARREADANAHATAAALQDLGGRDAASEPQPEPMDRLSPEAGRSPEPATLATTQPAGAAHTDPVLADRGWQADRPGVYVRNPQAAAPGTRRELAGYEAGSPDHQYGAPECAEADPEGAHFGRGPGEPMDTGRWPVLQADYGRMYIGPQAQAEAS
jgi:hypothetical protein